ncbi:hypothetical protein Aduo_002324 [Ancylostoma duodenale]
METPLRSSSVPALRSKRRHVEVPSPGKQDELAKFMGQSSAHEVPPYVKIILEALMETREQMETIKEWCAKVTEENNKPKCLIFVSATTIWAGSSTVPEDTKEQANRFACRNSLISDDWRKMVVNFHNDKRRILSSGEQPNKDGTALTAADKMNELVWDCNLERRAADGAAKCGSFTLADRGVNQKLFKSAGICDIKTKTKEVLSEWWDEVKEVGLLDDRKFAIGLENFANMVLSHSLSLACSYAKCQNGTQLLCVYEKLGAKTGTVLYPRASDASKACFGCPATAPCVNRLCRTTEFKISAETPQLCEFDSMTNDMSETALNMHNYYRRLLANGWAKDKVSVYAPPAKHMLRLKYDCGDENSLAYGAAQKTSGCLYPPKAPQLTTRSQNYLRIDDCEIDRLDALQQAIKTWWRELADYGVGAKTKYSAEMKTAGNLTNYVNMAFDRTTVGCSVGTCRKDGFTLVVCEYDK